MLKVGTLCYEKEKQYLGIVLEIKRIKKTTKLGDKIVSENEYHVIFLIEKSLVLRKFWTIDPTNKELTHGFSWELI